MQRRPPLAASLLERSKTSAGARLRAGPELRQLSAALVRAPELRALFVILPSAIQHWLAGIASPEREHLRAWPAILPLAPDARLAAGLRGRGRALAILPLL